MFRTFPSLRVFQYTQIGDSAVGIFEALAHPEPGEAERQEDQDREAKSERSLHSALCPYLEQLTMIGQYWHDEEAEALKRCLHSRTDRSVPLKTLHLEMIFASADGFDEACRMYLPELKRLIAGGTVSFMKAELMI